MNSRLEQEAFAIYAQSNQKNLDISMVDQNIQFVTSFWHQFGTVGRRTMKDLIRNLELVLLSIIAMMVMAVALAVMFWQIEKEPINGFTNRSGVLFLLAFLQTYFMMVQMEFNVKQRLHAMQEVNNGFYRVSVYFLVKLLVHCIPTRLVALVPASTIVYFAVGMRISAEAFLLYTLIMFAMAMAACGVGVLAVMVCDTCYAAQTVGGCFVIVWLMFSGFIVNLQAASSWISWMKYASVLKYTIEALYTNEFKDRTFCASVGNNTMCKSGNQHLSDLGIDYQTSWDFWNNLLAIVLYTVILFVLALCVLLRRTQTV